MQVGSVETGARGVLKPVEGKSNPAGEHDFISVLATVTGSCRQPVRDQSNHFLLLPWPATGLVSSPVAQKMQPVELKQADVAMVSGNLWFGGAVEAELAGSLQNTLANPLYCNNGESAAVACSLPDTWFAAQVADQVGQGEERNPLPGLTPLTGRQLSNAGKPSLEKLCLGNISGFRLPATDIRKVPALSSGYEIKSEISKLIIRIDNAVKNGGHDGSGVLSDSSRVRFPVAAVIEAVNTSPAPAAGRLQEQFSSATGLQPAESKAEPAAAVVDAATQKPESQNLPRLFVQPGQDFGAKAERFESVFITSEMIVKTEDIHQDANWKIEGEIVSKPKTAVQPYSGTQEAYIPRSGVRISNVVLELLAALPEDEISASGMIQQIPVEDSVLLQREFTAGSKPAVETKLQWVVTGENVDSKEKMVFFVPVSRDGSWGQPASIEEAVEIPKLVIRIDNAVKNSGHDGSGAFSDVSRVRFPVAAVMQAVGTSPVPGADIPIPSSSAPLGVLLVSAFYQVVSRGGFTRTIIRLKLEPEHLGELKVLLTYHRGKLTADFYTVNHPAREAVEALFPHLREVLASYNVRLENAAVHLNQNDGYGEGAFLKNEGSGRDAATSGQFYRPEDPVPAGTADGGEMYAAESVVDWLV